jgi:hypothetical protein
MIACMFEWVHITVNGIMELNLLLNVFPPNHFKGFVGQLHHLADNLQGILKMRIWKILYSNYHISLIRVQCEIEIFYHKKIIALLILFCGKKSRLYRSFVRASYVKYDFFRVSF